MPDDGNGNTACQKRAALEIAAGAAQTVLEGNTKAKLAYVVCGGFVVGVIYAMYIGGVNGDIAFVERCLFILGGAATTVISTFMGVNAALSAKNGTKP